MSWFDVQEFCNRLSQHTGKAYTLPSEAQWEYACRAGTSTPYHFAETISPDLATYNALQTTDVGTFPANAWGLHDMHGNVWEWCLDEWRNSYKGAPADGSAWVDVVGSDNKDNDTERRLLRGGSWTSLPRNCRSAYRSNGRPVNRSDIIGFRVCCLPQGSASLPLNS
ncbi:MAG: formylglycine-generating enzyme family protein [Cyanobacteriota bacterium]|nr:formylglycine-generating enzyme family protein [Cyanobacteriota bacterium]